MTLDQLLSKAFNGKAENIVISKNIIMFHLDGVETRINLVSFIDQIFNDHEAIIKAKDDQIKWLREELKYHEAELEALQSRSCDGCKFHDDVGWDDWCCDCTRKWTIDRYEAKEQ